MNTKTVKINGKKISIKQFDLNELNDKQLVVTINNNSGMESGNIFLHNLLIKHFNKNKNIIFDAFWFDRYENVKNKIIHTNNSKKNDCS